MRKTQLLALAPVMLVALVCPARSAQCVNSDEDRERIRAIAIEAFDRALQEHISHLFDIFLKDQSEQPKRARTGFDIGLNAYLRARSDAQNWNPPLCQK
jgi:hypothetical protein